MADLFDQGVDDAAAAAGEGGEITTTRPERRRLGGLLRERITRLGW